MSLYQDLTSMLQGEQNLSDTQAQTAERWTQVALGQQQLQERQSTVAALKTALSGGQPSDPTMTPSPDDTPIQAATKDIYRERNDSIRFGTIAKAIVDAGGSPQTAQTYITDALNASNRASLAQKRLIDEQKNLSLRIGGIAGTANDPSKADSFPDAYQQINALNPTLAKSLSWDKDPTTGQPIAGPTSYRSMNNLFNQSMDASKQLDLANKVADEKRKQDATKEQTALREAEIGKIQAETEKANAEAARARAGVTKETPDQRRRENENEQIIKAGDREPKQWDISQAASTVKQYVAKQFPGVELDPALIPDMTKAVAARTLEIRADNTRHLPPGQDPMTLSEARAQALSEQANFIQDRTIKGANFWNSDKTVKAFDPGAPAGTPSKTTAAPAGGGMPKLTSNDPAAYDALPIGKYIAPDGKVREKK